MEYIRETLSYGEELVLLDETEAAVLYDGPDPRRTSLRLRREALAAPPPSSSATPAGH